MDSELLSFLSLDIPPSLRPISLFLHEAQKAARYVIPPALSLSLTLFLRIFPLED